MIHVYTGNGKGKTTAALGLALRAAGAGKKVYICQFLKMGEFCEHISLKKFKTITCEQFGSCRFLKKSPTAQDISAANNGLKAAARAIRGKQYDVVILDEVNVALALKIIKPAQVRYLLKQAPVSCELILTGRNASPGIIKMADLVSEIKEVKHYFKKGLGARPGIEF